MRTVSGQSLLSSDAQQTSGAGLELRGEPRDRNYKHSGSSAMFMAWCPSLASREVPNESICMKLCSSMKSISSSTTLTVGMRIETFVRYLAEIIAVVIKITIFDQFPLPLVKYSIILIFK